MSEKKEIEKSFAALKGLLCLLSDTIEDAFFRLKESCQQGIDLEKDVYFFSAYNKSKDSFKTGFLMKRIDSKDIAMLLESDSSFEELEGKIRKIRLTKEQIADLMVKE